MSAVLEARSEEIKSDRFLEKPGGILKNVFSRFAYCAMAAVKVLGKSSRVAAVGLGRLCADAKVARRLRLEAQA